MTTIAAISAEIDGEVVVFVGSDSRACCSNEILNVNDEKIVKFPHFAVMYTGIATIGHVVKNLARDKGFLRMDFCKARDEHDIIEITRAIMLNLKDLLEASPDPNAGNDSRVIIATKDTVYSVDPYFFCYDTNVIADGSGGWWAQAVLEQGIDHVETEEDMINLLNRAIKYAISKDSASGGSIHILKVCPENLPPQPRIKRKKNNEE